MATTILMDFANSLFSKTMAALSVAIIFAVLFIVGLIVAKIVNGVIKEVLKRGRLEEIIKSKGLENALLGFRVTQIITTLVGLYIVLVFLAAAADIVMIGSLIYTLTGLISYLSSFSQGVIIIAIVLFIATYVTNVIKSSGRFLFAKQIASVIKFIIAYLGLILALPLLLPNSSVEVLTDILTLTMQALVVAFGLAFGLALGLGLKDPISKAATKNQALFDEVFSRVGKR
jgi:hypothetical protein